MAVIWAGVTPSILEACPTVRGFVPFTLWFIPIPPKF